MSSPHEPGPPIGAGQAHAKASAADPGTPTGGGLVAGLRRRVEPVVRLVTTLVDRWEGTRAARANARFGTAGGGLLTGGIAYSTLFSVFAALTIGYSAFLSVLGRDSALRQNVLDALASNLPGLIDTGDGKGLLRPDDLRFSPALSVTGIVAGVVLLVSATSALSSLRAAVRAMFDAQKLPQNALLGKLRDLAGFVGMALAVLVAAALTLAVTSAADRLLALTGISQDAGTVVRVLGLGVAFVVDAATFMLIVWVLAAQRPRWKDLLGGSLIAATGLGLLRVAGTAVVARGADRNALLASFTVVVTLLVWVNVMARVVLLAAAWTADPPRPAPVVPGDGTSAAPGGTALVAGTAAEGRPARTAKAGTLRRRA
ncbi:YihY/virulence factor BrkB family protein [Cellulomonas sp. P22]|uniref:YihY/virulence factor BrkB family protein n=1 Tax=Cellulomonas sp. P22 TaxID=3373189 RepID=UPI0037B8D2C7